MPLEEDQQNYIMQIEAHGVNFFKSSGDSGMRSIGRQSDPAAFSMFIFIGFWLGGRVLSEVRHCGCKMKTNILQNKMKVSNRVCQ